MWHVSSRSGVTTLRTATHLLLTYLLTYLFVGVAGERVQSEAGNFEHPATVDVTVGTGQSAV